MAAPLLRIVNARRASQVFFVLVTLWLCVVTTLGASSGGFPAGR